MNTNKHGKKLRTDDAWWRSELPAALQQRGFVTSEELSRVVRFKLARGKWRPRLQVLVDGLHDSLVARQSMLAFGEEAEGVDAAVAHLSHKECRGVGPATASYVLAAWDPARYPCFSDEAAEGAGFPREYTRGVYSEFAAALQAKAAELGEGWTPERVGRALWAEGLSSTAEDAHARAKKKSKKATKQPATKAAKQPAKKAAKKATKQPAKQPAKQSAKQPAKQPAVGAAKKRKRRAAKSA